MLSSVFYSVRLFRIFITWSFYSACIVLPTHQTFSHELTSIRVLSKMECISQIQDSGFKTVSFPFTIINDVIVTAIPLFKIICVLANFLILLDASLFMYSWFSHDVTKIKTKKLLLLLSFYFHVIYQSTIKPLYKRNFGSKGFLVLRYRTLEFPGFCVTRHLAGGRESSYVG